VIIVRSDAEIKLTASFYPIFGNQIISGSQSSDFHFCFDPELVEVLRFGSPLFGKMNVVSGLELYQVGYWGPDVRRWKVSVRYPSDPIHPCSNGTQFQLRRRHQAH
jgi:hypothetical protein